MVYGSSDYDLVIVGGGPSGSTMATLVAQAGHRVLLLERDHFPRHQVGESLLPATIHDLLPLLGLQETIENAGFTRKPGATFSWGADPELWPMNFGGTPEQRASLGDRVPYAYNVPRDKFDYILLQNAAEKGAEVVQGANVRETFSENNRLRGVKFTTADQRTHSVTTSWIADASGYSSPISSAIGQRTYSKFYQNVAVYAYFNHAKRLPSPDEGNVLFQAFDGGWIWYIPLADGLTSVGAVVPKQVARSLQANPETGFRDFIAACPLIAELLAGASRPPAGPYADLRIRKEFSYCNSTFWVPGGILLGDAACFVDVLLSSGVHIATYSALLAARAVNSILDHQFDEATALNAFELRFRLEFTRFYRVLMGLYDMSLTSTEYQQRLREFLQGTNGVVMDLAEINADDAVNDLTMRSMTDAQVVTLLRSLNNQLMKYEGPPTMAMLQPVPDYYGQLRPSNDHLHWVRR